MTNNFALAMNELTRLQKSAAALKAGKAPEADIEAAEHAVRVQAQKVERERAKAMTQYKKRVEKRG